jgi:ribonuclease VapC
MVIDASALVAILLGEPEAPRLAAAIAAADSRLLCSFNALEAGIVIEAKKGEIAGRELDLLLHRAKIDVVPLTDSLAEVSRAAWRRFGRGRHAASLNIGDCCAYALCRLSGEPLLFKGTHFARTDVAAAPY